MPQDFRERVCLKVALLGATFETGNHGVSALASGTITSLLHTFEDAEVQFLDYGREPVVSKARIGGRLVSIETVNLRFSKKPWQPNHIARLLGVAALVRLIPSRRLRSRWILRNPWLRRICDRHLHLSIAGGDSFSDIYGIRRLIYDALPQILVLLLNKPLVLLPQTYGPYKSRTARWIARYILRRAKLIYSRDREGLKVVTSLLGKPDERMRFGYDMGFALEPHPPRSEVLARFDSIRRRGDVVGLNVSGLLYSQALKNGDSFGLTTDYNALIERILEYFIDRQQTQILLIPHHTAGAEPSQSDWRACRAIFTRYRARFPDALHFIDDDLDHHEIKYLIGQCGFFLGSRMHACIASISQCVPTVGLAYSRKFSGVFSSVGGGCCAVDMREFGEREIVQAVCDAFRRRDVLRRELEEKIPGVRASARNLFADSEISNILGVQIGTVRPAIQVSLVI